MLMDAKETHCREELVKQIKDVGEELIIRAETLVPENLDSISDFYIDISFPQGDCAPIPEITVHTTVDVKRTLDRWRKEICLDQ